MTDSRTEIKCPHRTLRNDGPVCQIVADITALPLEQCVVNDGACSFCLGCGIAPETPNQVVASMSMHAASNAGNRDLIQSVLRKVQPYIKAGKTTGAPRVTADQLPCIHRGERLRQVECELCGGRGTVIDVHQCQLPGAETECTPGKWSKTTPHPNKTCIGCGQRQEPVKLQTPEEPRPYLSIVMPTYDDFEGVWATTQSIRNQWEDLFRQVPTEIVCLDTNPGSPHGACSRKLYQNWCNGNPDQGDPVKGRYVAAGGIIGPAAAKQKSIEAARGEVVLCIDCHLILRPGCLEALVEYFQEHPTTQDLVQGVFIRDDFKPLATHMAPVWGGDHMKGVWALDERALDANGNLNMDAEPFEIPQQGMGFFACRREAWLGFNPLFRGFVVEEGYIHEKYRKAGHKTVCIPQCRWLHRSDRPSGAPYSVNLEDRFAGYLIRAHELGEDPAEYLREFARTDTVTVMPPENYQRVLTHTQLVLSEVG